MRNKPLAGYQILELGESQMAAFCGQLLSDFGAEVIKIELATATGSLCRSHYAAQNRGKNSLVLDFGLDDDRLQFQSLVTGCQAFITDLTDLAARIGFTQQTLQSWNPQLIYSLISGYGATGPYAHRPTSDQSIQAESGIMSITGEENSNPILCGAPITEYLGGAAGCIGTLLALLGNLKDGAGRFVDVSALDAVLFGLESQFSNYLQDGIIPAPVGNNYHLAAPVGVFACRDGVLSITVVTDSQWQAFAKALGHPEWLANPHFSTIKSRIDHYQEINAEVGKACLAHTRDELIARLQSRHCVYGSLNDFADVAAHPQVVHRRTFVTAAYPGGDSYTVPTAPIRMNEMALETEYLVPENSVPRR